MMQHITQRHPQLVEILRFLLIGGLATVIDYLVMALFLFFTAATVISTGLGFIAGLIFNYIFSILFVFRTTGKSRSLQGFFLFTVLAIGGLTIHLIGMYLGHDLWHLNVRLVKVCLTLIVLVYNYLTRKFFIFNPQNSTKLDTSNSAKN